MISRQDSQTAGIVGYGFRKSELRGEIGKDNTRRFGMRPPEPSSSRHVFLQARGGPIQLGEKSLIDSEVSQAPLADPAEQQTRIMVQFLPQIWIETFEHISGGMVPSPAKV